jgi:hypothetical protein
MAANTEQGSAEVGRGSTQANDETTCPGAFACTPLPPLLTQHTDQGACRFVLDWLFVFFSGVNF